MIHLAEEQICTIMLVGCWTSDAFLVHIKKQVKEFFREVISRMLQHDTFHNTPLVITQTTSNNKNYNKSFQRANLKIFGGRQAGSLCHQLRERN